MINCRSLLYWGERISLVLPQTPPYSPPLPSHPPSRRSSFPWVTLILILLQKVSLFFCLQQKAYLISVPQQTPYLLSAPSTSSVQLFSPSVANQPPRTTTRRSRLQVFLIIKAFFFYYYYYFLKLLQRLSEWARALAPSTAMIFFVFVFYLR